MSLGDGNRGIGPIRSQHLDWRLLVAGVALMLMASYLLRLTALRSMDGLSYTPGLPDLTQPLKALLFLVGWLVFWGSLSLLRGVGRRVLLALVVYLLIGVAIRGLTPYTPLWSPSGFRRSVLDRIGAWLAWPQYVAGGPVSGFGLSELLMVLLIATLAVWLFVRRHYAS